MAYCIELTLSYAVDISHRPLFGCVAYRVRTMGSAVVDLAQEVEDADATL